MTSKKVTIYVCNADRTICNYVGPTDVKTVAYELGVTAYAVRKHKLIAQPLNGFMIMGHAMKRKTIVTHIAVPSYRYMLYDNTGGIVECSDHDKMYGLSAGDVDKIINKRNNDWRYYECTQYMFRIHTDEPLFYRNHWVKRVVAEKIDTEINY